MKLLFALAITNDNAAAAEKFLDYVRGYSGKQGHLVLGIVSNVHEEMKSRVRISAELAFDKVHEVALLPLADVSAQKTTKFNSLFSQIAAHINNCFTWPFLWLDAHCTPARPGWREQLFSAYSNQPYPYLGTRMKMKPMKPELPEIFFMAEVGIYPHNTSDAMFTQKGSNVPVHIESGARMIEKLGTTKIIQQGTIKTEGDLISVRDDAVLVCGDVAGLLRPVMMAEAAAQVEPVEVSEPVKVNFKQKPDPLVNRLAANLNGRR